MNPPIKKLIGNEKELNNSWTVALGLSKEAISQVQTQYGILKCVETNPSSSCTKYYLGKKYPDIYLTQREAECIWLIFLKDCTYQNIAQYLKLSTRTIEVYINNLKRKVSAKNKAELIALLKKTDFVRNSWKLGVALRKDMDVHF